MSRFEFNPADISTGFEVFPKGPYEFVLAEPKAYFFASTDPSKNNREGIRFIMTGQDGEAKGKVAICSPDFNFEFGPAQAKQISMAAYGYTTKQEKEYNEFAKSLDLHITTDEENLDLGQGWLDLKGKRVIANLDINTAKDGSGKEFQKWVSFEPWNG